MWKDYSMDYIRHNRAGGYSIMVAAFIAALFLSFLGSLFYNFWLDGMRETGKETPWVLVWFYLIVLMFLCVSLILVIHNSFAVSMNNRIHQFGIFSSIGATPGQIRICLIQEAFALTLVPVLLGILSGILLSFGAVSGMSAFAAGLAGGREMDFALHPAILLFILFLSFFTIFLSARIPAGKLSRLTPLEAIRGTGELQLARKKQSRILSALFGVEGELAGNALKAQRKALRTTTLSLIFAFLGFMLMQCFFTISSISTRHTYFEAYQDAWDVMVTVRDTKMEEFEATGKMREVQEAVLETAVRKSGPEEECGIVNCVIYQKAEAVSIISAESISPELLALGGPEKLAGCAKAAEGDAYMIKAPLVILDDKSFEDYCRQIGATPDKDGVVLLNQIWDSINSNFRHPEYVPYINEDIRTITLQSFVADGEILEVPEGKASKKEGSRIDVPVLACTQECPVLREEYEDYALVQFMALSLWKEIEGQIEGADKDLFIRVLAEERDSLETLEILENTVLRTIGETFITESENRLQEKLDNDRMIWGYKMILGAFCVLFATIGIAHVFSGTLGFLRQRKREFARYMSVGLTPEGMRRIFCIEAVIVVGRPVLITLALTAIAVAYMIKISYMDPMEFIKEAPVVPILLFILVVSGFTGLAYYLGGKKILQADLADVLRDDTVM